MIAKSVWKLIEKLAYIFLKLIYKIAQKDLTETKFESFMQFVKFGIVGLSNTIISYILYTSSLFLFRAMGWIPKVDYFVAQIVAIVLSMLWSFYWNNRLVFTIEDGKKRNMWSALLKTYISYSFTGLFLNSILIVLWVQVCHMSEFIAPILNLIISVPVNFLINKFWAFKSN